jgi:hypothetical protein
MTRKYDLKTLAILVLIVAICCASLKIATTSTATIRPSQALHRFDYYFTTFDTKQRVAERRPIFKVDGYIISRDDVLFTLTAINDGSIAEACSLNVAPATSSWFREAFELHVAFCQAATLPPTVALGVAGPKRWGAGSGTWAAVTFERRDSWLREQASLNRRPSIVYVEGDQAIKRADELRSFASNNPKGNFLVVSASLDRPQ